MLKSIKELDVFAFQHLLDPPFLERGSLFLSEVDIVEAGDEFEDIVMVVDMPTH